MSIFVIKIIACFFMIIDHIKYAVPSLVNWVTLYLGRIAFPLFAFCVVEGYIHTSNLNRYVKRLIIAGIVSQVPFMLFCSLPTINNFLRLNIMFTLLLGILAIKIYDVVPNKIISIISVIGVCFLGKFLKVDYEFFGVLVVFILYLFRESKVKKFCAFVLVVFVHYLLRCGNINNMIEYGMWKNCLCTCLPIIIMLLYNGKLGKKFQKFYYWFYPIHLLAFYFVGILDII